MEGENGYTFRAEDPVDLARAIKTYFASDLYADLNCRRGKIQNYANERHSWETVANHHRRVCQPASDTIPWNLSRLSFSMTGASYALSSGIPSTGIIQQLIAALELRRPLRSASLVNHRTE